MKFLTAFGAFFLSLVSAATGQTDLMIRRGENEASAYRGTLCVTWRGPLEGAAAPEPPEEYCFEDETGDAFEHRINELPDGRYSLTLPQTSAEIAFTAENRNLVVMDDNPAQFGLTDDRSGDVDVIFYLYPMGIWIRPMAPGETDTATYQFRQSFHVGHIGPVSGLDAGDQAYRVWLFPHQDNWEIQTQSGHRFSFGMDLTSGNPIGNDIQTVTAQRTIGGIDTEVLHFNTTPVHIDPGHYGGAYYIENYPDSEQASVIPLIVGTNGHVLRFSQLPDEGRPHMAAYASFDVTADPVADGYQPGLRFPLAFCRRLGGIAFGVRRRGV